MWLFLLALLCPWRSTCLVEQQLRETEVGTHSSSSQGVPGPLLLSEEAVWQGLGGLSRLWPPEATVLGG